ncbi:hypothetical protein EFR01_32230 [Sinorhizobium fredii]|nr:hypothetical protein EFR01_32230 [Sinorhizobium fredii]GLS09220.1 hypothetical protein GCM10007864_28500 [Sinorhizobium fredii]
MPTKAEPGGILPRRVTSTSDGRKPASVLPAPVGAISKVLCPASARDRSSSWWARGRQPFSANHRRKGAGNVRASLSGNGESILSTGNKGRSNVAKEKPAGLMLAIALTLGLSKQAGRGTGRRGTPLRPACGEKVAAAG